MMMAFQIALPAAAAMNPIQNPASNIYNPASRMDNPNPLSPPVPPVAPDQPKKQETVVPEPAVKVQPERVQQKPDRIIRSYNFESARAYINAANQAYGKGDILEFLAITEDALKRISAGKLKATKKSRQTLIRYQTLGQQIYNGKITP